MANAEVYFVNTYMSQ